MNGWKTCKHCGQWIKTCWTSNDTWVTAEWPTGRYTCGSSLHARYHEPEETPLTEDWTMPTYIKNWDKCDITGTPSEKLIGWGFRVEYWHRQWEFANKTDREYNSATLRICAERAAHSARELGFGK